jgi:hypothetical protein
LLERGLDRLASLGMLPRFGLIERIQLRTARPAAWRWRDSEPIHCGLWRSRSPGVNLKASGGAVINRQALGS